MNDVLEKWKRDKEMNLKKEYFKYRKQFTIIIKKKKNERKKNNHQSDFLERGVGNNSEELRGLGIGGHKSYLHLSADEESE